MPEASNRVVQQAGFVLQRIVVPLWILTGALFKLWDRTPSNLPVIIREKIAREWLVIDNLDALMRTLIGLELFAVAVILFVPRWSRIMAIFMLVSFCAILAGDMSLNAKECGCFGKLPMKPWHMLVIDGSMLLGVLFLPRARKPAAATSGEPALGGALLKSALAMIPLLIVGLGVSFAMPKLPDVVLPPPTPPTPTGSTTQAETQPDIIPTPKPPVTPQNTPEMRMPGAWNPPADVSKDWVGKNWNDIDLFKWMQKLPKDIDKGKHYVVFYRRTCDHCRDMFEVDLVRPLDAPVAAVEIPEDAKTMRPDYAWEMGPTGPWVELLELPVGCKFTVMTPLALRIEDGRVTCAKEGDHKECFGLK